jgi:histidinol phosphatase-like PHP family hydrolase
VLDNVDIAELLARCGEQAEGHRARAYLSAARAALMWAEEASALLAEGRSLTELERVGPSLARKVTAWMGNEPEVPEPPPMRKGFSSFAAARAIWAAEPSWRPLRGDLQMHTVYSDGKESVADMALEGAARGYDYVAVTDHSQGLKIAGGMDPATLELQGREIAALNEALAADGVDLYVLRGLEMNIDVDGARDMEPHDLAPLELVLGSFHSALRRSEDQTRRYLAALEDPHVDVIGHPRGRRFNQRLGVSAEWPRVIEAAAAGGKALEIDCYPDRQDLSVELLELVRDAEGWVSIGTDAHNRSEMRFIDIGVAAAISAGIPKSRVLNFMGRDELLAWAQAHRAP